MATLTFLSAALAVCPAQAPAGAGEVNAVRIESIEKDGIVEILTPGSAVWVRTTAPQILGPGTRLRTGLNTRAVLRWSEKSLVRLDSLTLLEVLPPEAPASLFGINFLKGILSFFHRDQPGRIRIMTQAADAGVKGTEFVLEVSGEGPAEQTRLSVVDGLVQFSNPQGSQPLTNGQESFAVAGQAPSAPAGFIVNNRLQWCFYYPAILDLQELPLTAAEQTDLAGSLRAYRLGDLLNALRLYPAGRIPASDAERLYHAAILLAVGRVADTETALASLTATPADSRIQRLAGALRLLIAVVKADPNRSQLFTQLAAPQLATEFMAASYYEQSLAVRETSLEAALALAKAATTNSPSFGFAWERVAELEFSFGRTERAVEALEKGYELSPRNAEGLSLEGFLLAAQNKTTEAIVWFNYALQADSSLGNAWLGRGLCRIRKGDLPGGRDDLLVAAALEPQRALLRSYLGKAYGDEGDYPRAAKELSRSKRLDPKDPTPWLYSALLNQQYNRINEAIRDLEYSQELNDNRSVYRSGLLLDEDRAVRSANLASIYRDAGMFDVSLREASRAVSYDYANYSAHVFLANSFDQLRDPNRINLRYETPAEAEYLIANILSPANAGTFSHPVSDQEYSRLFDRDRVGAVSDTEYLSRGAWIENGAVYGVSGDMAYSLEAVYRSDPGQHANGDFLDRIMTARIKQDLTPQDGVFFEAAYYEATGGDRSEVYDPSLPYPQGPNLDIRTQENQDPTLTLGYHHQWAPGLETVLLGARLSDRISVRNPAEISLVVDRTPLGLDYVEPFLIHQQYHSELEIYSAEIQQIWQTQRHVTIVGGRFQTGSFDTMNLQVDPYDTMLSLAIAPDSFTPVQQTNIPADFNRIGAYVYHRFQVIDSLSVVGGVSYDRLTFPTDFRAAPITAGQSIVGQVSPKAGLSWSPWTGTLVRGAYTRSLSGASIDQSYQLEPTEVAGFLQSFRSIIPESLGGAESGARFRTYHASIEQKLTDGTYLSLKGEVLHSDVQRALGEFELNANGYATSGVTADNLSYQEKSVVLTFDQLLGNELAAGSAYHLSRADLWDRYSEVLPIVDSQDPLTLKGFRRNQHLNATLHHVDLHVVYNHPCGFFGRLEALWYSQAINGYATAQSGDHFWQLNAFVGYRFPSRRAEIAIGGLNLLGNDYRLNPITYYNELPRQRALFVHLHINL